MQPTTTQTPAIKPATTEWAYPDLDADYTAGDNSWREVSEGFFYDALSEVPTIYVTGGFLVSEAYTHNDEGRGVYACFTCINGRHYARYATLKEATALIEALRDAL